MGSNQQVEGPAGPGESVELLGAAGVRGSSAGSSEPVSPEQLRQTRVWREWLSSMAKDPEAALSAAMTYRDLAESSKDAWLSCLKQDAHEVNVPAFALYAPLLAVEREPLRRARMLAEMGEPSAEVAPKGIVQAWEAGSSRTERVLVLSLPLYLDFVQVLACAIGPEGLRWVRHDPIRRRGELPLDAPELAGVRLEACPWKPLLDELAFAFLKERRAGRALPEALMVLVDLLGAVGP